jgi:hypothetical protein
MGERAEHETAPPPPHACRLVLAKSAWHQRCIPTTVISAAFRSGRNGGTYSFGESRARGDAKLDPGSDDRTRYAEDGSPAPPRVARERLTN